MKDIVMKTKSIVEKTLLFSLLLMATLAMSTPANASCNGVSENYRKSIVTYYEELPGPYDPTGTTDSRCTLLSGPGPAICRVRLRGVLYRPLTTDRTTKFPAIIVNHGSGANFEASSKACEIANYFAPKGYIVFVPFRRGYGDDDPPYPDNRTELSDKSTGVYMEDFIADFASGNPMYNHLTSCTLEGCYRAELFEQEAGVEVADYAINYLRNRYDVKTERGGDPVVAFMGNSYGGAITVLANEISSVQKAAVGFSVASQQWALADCPPNDQTCALAVQQRLLTAAGNAKRPAFYLQAKWDYDTRATIDLAYAHAYGGSDHTHSQRFMASIFPYPNPCNDDGDPVCNDDEFQSVHTGFYDDTSRWGPFVLEFIRQYGVK